MADAAARQLQYEYKAVSKKCQNSTLLHIPTIISIYIELFIINSRTLILYYKLMCDSSIDVTVMRPQVKYVHWLENWKVQRWVIVFKEPNL